MLFLLVAFVYLPALHGGFIWDDQVLITDSPLIKAADGLYRLWFTTEAHDYWPLTSTTFWVEWRLWGMDPTGYHVTNFVLHAIEALLLWAILARLQVPGAYLAALIFAVHPVNVESVAWIAQRKNLVGMLFGFLSVSFYLSDDVRRRDPKVAAGPSAASYWYWLSLVAFLLALLGKGSLATLPAIFLLLVWWKQRTLALRDVIRVSPFFAIAGALAVVNVWFQTHGASVPIRTASPLERLLGAGAVVWFYLWKALWPLELCFIYPQWKVDASQFMWWVPLLATVVVSTLLYRFRGTWGRGLWFAWAFFCVALLPVMGFTDVYFMRYSLVADHYQHIAIVGVIGLVAAGWHTWWQAGHERSRIAAACIALAMVGALSWLAHRQSATYRDEEAVYRATIQANPDSWLAHYNLAVLLKLQGRREEEIVHLREAIHARPDYAEAHNNLALALLDLGRTSEALVHAERTWRLTPDQPEALVNLGIALSRAGRAAEALGPLERAVRLLPKSADAQHNLGITLSALGRHSEAIEHHREAVRLEPEAPGLRTGLAKALVAAGRDEEALLPLQDELRLTPDDAGAHVRLARALVRVGRSQAAIERYEAALRLSPAGHDAAESHYNLGVLLAASGRRRDAMGHYQSALQLRPDYAEAHNNLAIALLAEGRIPEAIAHYEAAVRIRPELLVARLNLADAYARAGRLSEAVAQAEQALDGAPPGVRVELERRLRLWRARVARQRSS